MSKKDKHDESQDLDFEQALEQVEQIVARLEGGQLGLSESLQQYEQGIQQLQRCHQLLDAAEQRVNVLAGFDAEGEPVLQPLPESSARNSATRSQPGSDASPGKGDGESDEAEGPAHGLF